MKSTFFAYATVWQTPGRTGLSLGYSDALSADEALGKAVAVGSAKNPGMGMTNQSVLEIELPFLDELNANLKKACDALDELCQMVGLDPETSDLETAMAAIKARLVA